MDGATKDTTTTIKRCDGSSKHEDIDGGRSSARSNKRKPKDTFSLAMIFWMLSSVLTMIISMLYIGDKMGLSREIQMSSDMIACLSRNQDALQAADDLSIWLRNRLSDPVDIDVLIDTLDEIKEVIERHNVYTTNVKSNGVSEIGVFFTSSSSEGTYAAVKNCKTLSLSKEHLKRWSTYCAVDENTKYVGQTREFRLFGDARSRFYPIGDSAGSFVESTPRLSKRGTMDPRGSMWFESAIQGHRDGVWIQYRDIRGPIFGDHDSGRKVVFTKTFHAEGNSVVPGMPGGGVVYVALSPFVVASCE